MTTQSSGSLRSKPSAIHGPVVILPLDGGSLMPQRIQRKRVKGWRMPSGTVYVGRNTEWGNPYVVGAVCAYNRFGIRVELTVESKAHSVQLFERWVARDPLVPRSCWNLHSAAPTLARIREALAGKDLACWCPPGDACHADVLLRIANGGES